MISFNNFNSFDIVIGVIFLFFTLRGGWIGFMRQLAAFLALVGSYWIAGRYSNLLMPYIGDFIQNPKLVFFASFGLLFCISALLFILGGKVLHKVMEITLLGWFDRFLGVVLGAAKALVLASFLYMVLASSLSASNNLLKNSMSSPYLAQGAAILHQLIQDPQLQKYFIPRKPAIPKETIPAKQSPDKKTHQVPVPRR